jgi:L-fucose isomerase-like protein
LIARLHDAKFVEKVISNHRKWLGECYDHEISPAPKLGLEVRRSIKSASGVLALVVTGGTERLIHQVLDFGQPTMVIAHESMNSLPSALEALSPLEKRPELVVAKTRVEMGKIRRFVEAAKAFARIRDHRLGLIGGASPWLTYSRTDRTQLSHHLGIKLIDIPMSEFKRAYHSVSKPIAQKLAIDAESKGILSQGRITIEDFRKSSVIYAAIRKLAEEHKLTAASFKCFDLIADFKATGCYAVAKLNDEDFVTGCEGDIPATAAMIVLSEISKSPTFLANTSFVRGRNLVLSHCTIAPRLTTRFRYRTHFESGLGVAIAGVLKKGRRATILRFSNTLEKLRAGEGVVVKGDAWSEQLCRTQTQIKMDGDAQLIKDQPMGNHYVVAYGEHVGTLRTLASFAGMKFEEI